MQTNTTAASASTENASSASTDRTPIKTRGANYKSFEDKVLCEVWLSSSRNPVKGMYQSSEDFYLKVKAAFDTELIRLGKTVADRPPASLSSRFQTISHAVSKFVACHSQVLNVCASGRSPVDIEHDAIALYQSKL
ncbi:hypothetical protein DVH05_017345 [Phytophthora capsici]|nr:hypothetical protein DVH05_017345 [Phytophthora capsici]